MKYAFRQALALAQPLLACMVLGAEPGISQASLSPPLETSAYLPRETLSIDLGEFAADASTAQLSIEIDTVDVTAMAVLNGNKITYIPVKPLSAGKHELRLMAYFADGSISELGYWLLDVRDPSFLRNASLSGQATLNVTQRLDNSRDMDTPNELQAQGSASYQLQAQVADAEFSGNIDLLYLNPSDYSATGESLDLGSFVAKIENDNSSATIGHQTLTSAGLMFDGYQKRGIALGGHWQAARSKITVFGMSAQDVVGRDDLLGINDSDNRYQGGIVNSQLWHSEQFESHLTSAFLTGTRTQAGYGNWSEPDASIEADGWGLTLDNYWFSRQLRVRLEGASSSRKKNEDTKSDDAYSALLVINPHLASVQWQLGLEAKEIGADYYSLANPYLPTDRSAERIFTTFNAGKWNATATTGRETTNVDEHPNRSVTEQALTQVSVSYSDYGSDETGSVMAWLGNPSYTLTVQQSSIKDDYTAIGIGQQDSESEAAMLNAAFSAPYWQWSLGYSVQTFEDYTDTQVDSRIESLFANLSLQLGDAISLQPGWQRQRTDNRDYDSTTYSTLYNLTGQFTLIPRRLSASLSWNQNAVEALDDPFYVQDNRNQFLSGQITWQARLAEANRVGVEIALIASSQDYQDYLFNQNNNDSYQIFVTIKTTLPSQLIGGSQ